MSGFYMLGRLLWRPAGWLMLLVLAMVSFIAGLDMAQGPQDLLAAGIYGEASHDQRMALWRLATMLPALAGLLASFSARELQHTFFAWTLPGLAGGLRTGKTIFGVAFVILIALFAARMLGPWIAAAAFGWSVLCFALAGVAFDPVVSNVESKGVVAILALLLIRPAHLEQLILLQPLLFAAVATLASWAVLHREFSTELSRKRPLFGVPPTWTSTPYGTSQFWSRSSVPSREWNETLANDHFSGWLRAGYYEAYGGVRRGWAGIILLQVAFAIAMAHFMDSPYLVLGMSWFFLSTAAIQLRTKFLYPISRAHRASLFFASTALETGVIAGVALVAVIVLFSLGTATNATPPNVSLDELARGLAFFIAWAPVAHWAKIREPWTGENSTPVRLALRFLGFHLAFITLSMGSVGLLRWIAPTSSLSWVTAVILGAVIYAIYWRAIRRYYGTSDLVFARK